MKQLTTNRTQTEQITTIPRGWRQRKRMVEKFGPFQVAVAKQLGVTTAAVNRVWQGSSTSARIHAAIVEELNRRISEKLGKQSAA